MNRFRVWSLAFGSPICIFAASPCLSEATDPNSVGAQQILKAMSTYMASQKNLSASYDATLEVVTPEIEKLQFSASGTAEVSRPDKLRLIRHGAYSDVELDFDGETTTIVDRMNKEYAQFARPAHRTS